MTQPTKREKVRMSPRVNRDIVRLAKSKAVAQDVTLEWVVEQLLTLWVNGRISLNDNKESGRKSLSM